MQVFKFLQLRMLGLPQRLLICPLCNGLDLPRTRHLWLSGLGNLPNSIGTVLGLLGLRLEHLRQIERQLQASHRLRALPLQVWTAVVSVTGPLEEGCCLV